jgi:myosin-15
VYDSYTIHKSLSFFAQIGAKVTEYLLEKSRIVTHAPEERNYHVFYELLAGLPEDQRLKYGLMSAEKYFYLNQGGSCTIDGKLDREDFQSLLSAMQVRFYNNSVEVPSLSFGSGPHFLVL